MLAYQAGDVPGRVGLWLAGSLGFGEGKFCRLAGSQDEALGRRCQCGGSVSGSDQALHIV